MMIKQMKQMVETYFNTELSDIVFEVDKLEDWKSIAAELGLDNQLKLTKGTASPVPFPFMNTVMERVYETLCPMKVEFKAYKVTPIPLEVLKMIKLAVNDNHFGEIEIWYDDKSPDPLVVGKLCKFYGYYTDSNGSSQGCNNEKGSAIYFNSREEHKEWCIEKGFKPSSAYPSDITKYIIARWGDELRNFAELKELALARFLDNEAGELQKDLATLTNKLKLIKENSVSYFNGNMTKYDVTGKHS